MSRNRNQSDMVTIVYPPGCREITDDLGQDELIRRLKTLAHTFQTLTQAEDESTYADYTPLAIHLADDHYFSHQSRDVQLLVACCIADILRIFAPEAPYKDPAQIKTIFLFLIKQLGGLKDPKDPAFKRYFYLLENLAYVKSFNMCFDLEDCNEVFCALFQLLFKIVNDEHSSKVKNFMLDVLTPLITEADFVSNELLDIILINIVEPLKTQRKNSYQLARDLIIKTSTTLQLYIQQFFNQILILGKSDNNLQIARKVFDLIYELHIICPKILVTVLPQLEFKLKSTDEAERLGSVSLLARMFSERNSSLARNHRQLWLAFIGRYNDISVAIRTKCVQYTMHFLLNHPELTEDITGALKMRTHDAEENVRYQVVIAIVATAKKNFDIVSESEDLLNFVKERTLDKKFKIRKEAMSGLAMIYKKQLSNPENMPEATKKAVTWIKDKILHGYYMPGMEDRTLVERLLNTCLVPFNLESEERMKKLYLLFATIDEHASKAFIEIQKTQFIVRKAVAELVALHRNEQSEKRDKEIQVQIHAVSKHLVEPVKGNEFLRKFSHHMLTDKIVLELIEKILDPETTCSKCMENVNQLLKKLGAPVMTNLYYSTIKQLLERVSSVMVDKEAISHLTKMVLDAIEGGSILQELGLDSNQAVERGLKLLLLLAFVFPSHFLDANIIQTLIDMVSQKGNVVAPLSLSVLSFIGKHKPLGDIFPDQMNVLVPICKEFIKGGIPKQAKQAIKCLFMNTTITQDPVFAEILEQIKSNLEFEKGEQYLTAIVSLGHVAYHLPDKYPVHIKNLVSRKIVKELIMQDRTEARDQSITWMEESELPLETRCKMEGMKMMARWLLGLKEDKEDDPNESVSLSAKKTFRMLVAIIENQGDLLQEQKVSPAEKAWLRLAAGSAMLKICEQKGVGDQYNVQQFYTLSTLFIDEEPQGLGKGLPNKCLPLDFMGLFVLAGLEEDKTPRNKAKAYMNNDINKRKDFVKSILLSTVAADRVSQQLHRILPDFMIVYAVPILTHLKMYEEHDDTSVLRKFQNALWFILEPLIHKNENFSFGFYKSLIETMKGAKDKLNPEDEETNLKLWTLCDLAMTILISKTSNYELKEFPTAVTLPQMFYLPVKDPSFTNTTNYLPPELIPKVTKKTGAMASYLQPNMAKPHQSKHEDKTASSQDKGDDDDNENDDDDEKTDQEEETNKESDHEMETDAEPSKNGEPERRTRSKRSTDKENSENEEESTETGDPVSKKAKTNDESDGKEEVDTGRQRPRRATRK